MFIYHIHYILKFYIHMDKVLHKNRCMDDHILKFYRKVLSMVFYHIFQSIFYYTHYACNCICNLQRNFYMDLRTSKDNMNEDILLCIIYYKEGMVCYMFYQDTHDCMDLFFHIFYCSLHEKFDLNTQNIFLDMDVRILMLHYKQIRNFIYQSEARNQ